jgi:hypothetical protein
MRLPVIRGVIDRRILANFRIDAEVMSRVLPPPFRPKLCGGYAIGGICLIRLKQIRPRLLPVPWGLGSENAAHRVAVEWDVDGQTHQGVYVPRRDTDSRLNTWAGGTIFPGVQHHASFTVTEADDRFDVAMQSDDGDTSVRVSGSIAQRMPSSSVFESIEEASKFFETDSLGYSDARAGGRYDGMELRCDGWRVEPLAVDRVESSYFQDESRFPPGSVEFDCALLMRGIEHEWHSRDDLCCPVAVEA